ERWCPGRVYVLEVDAFPTRRSSDLENEALYEYMHELGYLVVLKPTIDVTTPQGEDGDKKPKEEKHMIKGNVDAELVLYALKEMRSEEHTSDSSHVKISYAVFCVKKK